MTSSFIMHWAYGVCMAKKTNTDPVEPSTEYARDRSPMYEPVLRGET